MTSGLVRDEDGILGWHGGRHYTDPGEAVKTWWAGRLRVGCAEAVHSNYSSGPCGSIATRDLDANGRPTRCGTHCADAKAKRQAASNARWLAYKAKADRAEAIRAATAALEPALRQIANGHNDPRALAQEVLAALDAARGKAEPT